MHVKEKYDQIISTIERLVQDPTLSSHEIGMVAAKLAGMQLRDLSAVFSFLMDMTLNGYITGRKMDMAYFYLTQPGKKLDIQAAVDITGYSDQAAFTKAFRRRYSMTPKEAHIKQDLMRMGKPLFWDALSKSLTLPNPSNPIEREFVEETKIFGVPESSFSIIAKAMELESFYGLPRAFSSYAFELSKKVNASMEECFKYADSLYEFMGEIGDTQGVTPEELKEIGDDIYYQSVFFTRGISVSTACELRCEYQATLDELMKCDMTMLNMFPGFEQAFSMSFSYYVRAYEYYAEHFEVQVDDDCFNDYIDLVMVGTPIEEAFDEIYPYAALEDEITHNLAGLMEYDVEQDLAEEEEYWKRNSSIEEYDSENEKWIGKRIDDDLYDDPDNRGYYDCG